MSLKPQPRCVTRFVTKTFCGVASTMWAGARSVSIPTPPQQVHPCTSSGSCENACNYTRGFHRAGKNMKRTIMKAFCSWKLHQQNCANNVRMWHSGWICYVWQCWQCDHQKVVQANPIHLFPSPEPALCAMVFSYFLSVYYIVKLTDHVEHPRGDAWPMTQKMNFLAKVSFQKLLRCRLVGNRFSKEVSSFHFYKIPIIGVLFQKPFSIPSTYLVKTDHVEHFKGDRLADDRKNELS